LKSSVNALLTNCPLRKAIKTWKRWFPVSTRTWLFRTWHSNSVNWSTGLCSPCI